MTDAFASPRLHALRVVLATAAITFACVVAAAVVVPSVFGWRALSVMSGSMAPSIGTGDAVVVRPVDPATLQTGDVVTFRDPEGTERLITHRVRGFRVHGAYVEVTTQGDANNTTERWQVPTRGTVGRVVYRLPKLGYVLVPSASPIGRMLLVAVPAVLLGALTLLSLWRTRPEQEPVAAPVSPPPVPRLPPLRRMPPPLPPVPLSTLRSLPVPVPASLLGRPGAILLPAPMPRRRPVLALPPGPRPAVVPFEALCFQAGGADALA